MKWFNKILAKVDLALIKRSRITKTEDKLKELKNTLTLEQRLIFASLFNFAQIPQYNTQIALFLSKKELNNISQIMQKYPQCRLEKVIVVDATDNLPDVIPFSDQNGERSVSVGNITSLYNVGYLEFVFYNLDKSVQKCIIENDKANSFIINTSEEILALGKDKTFLPHHYLTWKSQFQSVYNLLKDESSKQNLVQIIKARTTGNPIYYIKDIYSAYCHPNVVLHQDDTLMCVGGNDIGIIKQAGKTIGDKGHIFSINAHLNNKEKFCGIENVTFINPATCCNHSLSSSDCVNNSFACIDLIMKEYKIDSLNFLKIDALGDELIVLESGIETLRNHLPNLAISIHYKPTHIFEIPLFIDKLNLGYKFYIGHHSETMLDTILYATVG
ncbi:FkbM family methyltransferase [Desulfovibrio litoralis]|uniref:Methyltransferase FkbM domain-containing protein n=1 Tax=Desulfovibrio litoralis DSM 11393 TaxID=1121455 RepID=A0A1M7RSI9_9BACT|nr:FkbM family methyltransferase [Desulfovibrio litoralis]SHN49086.1 Methyltransferase FkbM domain-containing protein [Desulfovibrio litoralis DSM 11393]